MAKSQTGPILSLTQLQRGYLLTVDNAMRCFAASSDLLTKFPDKALALSQLGQEEIGKSLTLLAGGSLPADPEAWHWFWQGWRDHRLKAHRAYLYEIVHPLRIEVRGPDGANYDGGPLLDQLTDEKEVGLYVDYDAQLGTFTGPTELVDEFAAFCRFSTIAYLAATADAVRRALLHEDQDFRFREFGTLAMRICSEQIYQQDWPGMRDRFAATSPRHQALIADLTAALASVSTFFQKVQARRHGPGPEAPAAEA